MAYTNNKGMNILHLKLLNKMDENLQKFSQVSPWMKRIEQNYTGKCLNDDKSALVQVVA